VKTSKLAYANRWHDRSLTLSSLNTQQIQVESFKFFQVSYIFRNVKVVKCILLIYTIHDIPGAFDLHMLSTDSCEWVWGGWGGGGRVRVYSSVSVQHTHTSMGLM